MKPKPKDFAKSLIPLSVAGGVFVLLAVSAGAAPGVIWNIMFYIFLVVAGAFGYHKYLTADDDDDRI